MGRRSVNTTKSGKFMNPTDQARKEARKKELKKNKKQRMAVRHAVLKAKDPLQLLEETALYDKQEYDPSVEASLNERVIQEKRKKLLETFDRLVILYRKEDADYANRLQAARLDYDKKRHHMMLFYEQVKLAERVKTSDIPLPKLPQSQLGLVASDIPLPAGSYARGILKKSLGIPGLPPGILPAGTKPPGPPPGTPPDLSDSEGEDVSSEMSNRTRKIRFADADDLTTSGATSSSLQSAFPDATPRVTSGFSAPAPHPSQIPLPPPTALPSFTGLIRPGFPGAPQPNQIRFMFQPSAGAVLSAPPSLHPRDPLDNAEAVSGSALQTATSRAPAAVLQSKTTANTAAANSTGGGGPLPTTIEAKPQLKNLIGDATRFVPTALKVRRVTKDSAGRIITVGGGGGGLGAAGLSSGAMEAGKSTGAAFDRVSRTDASALGMSGQRSQATTSKDDAYDEFMREMDGLL